MEIVDYHKLPPGIVRFINIFGEVGAFKWAAVVRDNDNNGESVYIKCADNHMSRELTERYDTMQSLDEACQEVLLTISKTIMRIGCNWRNTERYKEKTRQARDQYEQGK